MADFFNYRVLFVKDDNTVRLAAKGMQMDYFNYPTDVKLYKVIVADAYNNRAQVFDQEGNFLKLLAGKKI